jgi:hypothetical protein
MRILWGYDDYDRIYIYIYKYTYIYIYRYNYIYIYDFNYIIIYITNHLGLSENGVYLQFMIILVGKSIDEAFFIWGYSIFRRSPGR